MEENNVITEGIVENAVQKACESLTTTADTTVALQKATETAVSATTSNVNVGKTVLVGVGGLVTGGIAGYCIDHWAIPAIKKGWANHKAKKAAKKAEKEQKKAAKDKKPAAQAEKPAPAPANQEDEGIDPRDIDTKID